MWNMKAGKPPEEWDDSKKGKIVQIPSMKIDDIIYGKVKPNTVTGLESGQNTSALDKVWALKVDTQGFEPQVFAGLKESIKNQKFQYIMTEYWPNGIGLLNNKMDNKCDLAFEILTTLTSAGYTLYALPTLYHPKARTSKVKIAARQWKDRPLHDAKADCQYFLDLETRFPNPKYKMGYWTDVLALAPGAKPIVPTTFGQV